jgi:hypothetical protein
MVTGFWFRAEPIKIAQHELLLIFLLSLFDLISQSNLTCIGEYVTVSRFNKDHTKQAFQEIFNIVKILLDVKHCLFLFASLFSIWPELSDEVYRDLFRLT